MYYIAFIVFILDQISKTIVLRIMEHGESIPVLKNIFHLTYLQNTGIAFGLLLKYRFFIIAVSIVTILLIISYKNKIISSKKLSNIFLGFILGGAVGNLVDRLRFGSVIDFLDFRIWPVFNIADSFICIGVGGIIICILFFSKKE
jgi:signal peptidase II